MREKILEALKDETKGQDINTINSKIQLKGVEGVKELEATLAELVKEGIVHMSKNHEYLLMSNTKSLRVGVLKINKMVMDLLNVNQNQYLFIMMIY